MLKFPAILRDLDFTEEKDSFEGVPSYVIGECEFAAELRILKIEDDWYPTKEGYLFSAEEGKFKACTILVENLGFISIPMNKNKFKRAYKEQMDELLKSSPQPRVQIVKLEGKENIINFLNQIHNQEDEQQENESESERD